MHRIFQKLPVNPLLPPAGNGFLAPFRAGEGEGSEGWRPTSVTPSVQVGSLMATSPHRHWLPYTAVGLGYIFTGRFSVR